MNEGWLELESDPGLFSLLVEEFGVKGVQVEEIYDLQKPIEGPVFGFIFLFKWIEERRARRKILPADEAFVSDEDVVNSMFFAQQIVPNSCATHAILSVLLNCPNINLGNTLTGLKTFSKNFTPESKGYAIGNVAEIAKVHNCHAHPEPRRVKEKQQSGITTTSRTHEAFHFVSYVPINGRLFELDGLKPYPIDHGPWGDHEEWTEKFRRVIAERLENEGGQSDIRFNLMAVVADRRLAYEQRLSTLNGNKQVILDALQKLMHVNRPHLTHPSKSQQATQQVKPSPDKVQVETVKVEESTETNITPVNEEDSITPLQSDAGSKDAAIISKSNTETKEEMEVTESQMGEQVKKKKKTPKIKICAIAQPYRLPAALDSHNYAKSPLESDEESSSEYVTESDTEETDPGKSSSCSSTSTSSSNSSGAETDSESSTEDKAEVESDNMQSEDVAPINQNKAELVTAESNPEENVVQQIPDLPPPKTGSIIKMKSADSENKTAAILEKQDGNTDTKMEVVFKKQGLDAQSRAEILKKQGGESEPKTEGILKKPSGDIDKSDMPALRVTFCDAPEEKQIEDVDIEIIDSTMPADISKPLTIQTVFENGPPSPASSNYSTDSASEAGSAFNSPIRSTSHSRSVSPNSVKQLTFKEWKSNVISEERAKLEATILELDQKESTTKKSVLKAGAHMGTRSKVARAAQGMVTNTRHAKRLAEQTSKRRVAGSEDKTRHAGTDDSADLPTETWNPPRPSFLVSQNGKQPFAPRDLLELLKSVEAEIDIYQQKLQDEVEKRTKYQIDDCRRTHNYDPFICTFLTMLAEQGKLSALVDKHTIIKRRQGISLGHLQKSRKRDRRRSRSRPKKSKLK